MPDLVLAVSASVVLTGTLTGLTAALMLERARRHDLAKSVEELRKRLASLERVNRSPLYRESLEDQRARQLRAADDAATGIAYMEQAIRILRKGSEQ